MKPLILCQACHRHFKAEDGACPFCRSKPPSLTVALPVLLAAGLVLTGSCTDDQNGDDQSSTSSSSSATGDGGWGGYVNSTSAYAGPPCTSSGWEFDLRCQGTDIEQCVSEDFYNGSWVTVATCDCLGPSTTCQMVSWDEYQCVLDDEVCLVCSGDYVPADCQPVGAGGGGSGGAGGAPTGGGGAGGG